MVQEEKRMVVIYILLKKMLQKIVSGSDIAFLCGDCVLVTYDG